VVQSVVCVPKARDQDDSEISFLLSKTQLVEFVPALHARVLSKLGKLFMAHEAGPQNST
jgi:hypothetical protein